MVPSNFLRKRATLIRVWNKSYERGQRFWRGCRSCSSASHLYLYSEDYTVPADADYFHITTNNTIYGTELKEDLDVNVPMVADMSSDSFLRPIDVSKYICTMAQKNLAPSGVIFVIVKNDAVSRYIPTT